MGQQVGDAEGGVAHVLAHLDGDGGAVGPGKDAVDGQGHGGPLVLADAAVVVGLEQAEVGRLIQGVGADVQPGRVDVGDDQVEAVLHRAGADGAAQHHLALVDPVDLLAGGVLFAVVVQLVAGGLQGLLGIDGHFPLGLAPGQEVLVSFAEGGGRLPGGGVLIAGVSGLIQQGLGLLLCFGHFFHVTLSLSVPEAQGLFFFLYTGAVKLRIA